MRARRAGVAAVVAAAVVALTGACGSGSGPSTIDDVAQTLKDAGVCDTSESIAKEGLVPGNDPDVQHAVRSLKCSKAGDRKVFATEFDSADARDRVFGRNDGANLLKGSGDRIWILEVTRDVAPQVRESLGDAVAEGGNV